jgi:DNA replication and repair protein RecF
VCFRNFFDTSLHFHSALNIFIGRNAQGKTNIIESIYILMQGSSYRTADDQNLIHWTKSRSYVLGEICQKEECYQINIQFQNPEKGIPGIKKRKKIIKVNKKKQRKSWFLSRFSPVIFTPGDLQIIKNSPSIRRRFLDEDIVNLNPMYYRYLKNYQHILYQRNMLLKNSRNNREINRQLTVWDQKMIELGTYIILNRVKILQKLNQKAKFFHQLMTENKETIKLKYNSNVLSAYTDDQEKIGHILNQKLNETKEKDFQLKVTTVGPHRDDYFIMNNDINLGIYGSQGQQRTAALSLKLAELELFKEKEGEYPPLLLDDVMSELDSERKIFLAQLIKDRPIQTFITSISLEDLVKGEIKQDSRLFQVKNGRIEE